MYLYQYQTCQSFKKYGCDLLRLVKSWFDLVNLSFSCNYDTIRPKPAFAFVYGYGPASDIFQAERLSGRYLRGSQMPLADDGSMPTQRRQPGLASIHGQECSGAVHTEC